MAVATDPQPAAILSDAVVAFALDGRFPETDAVSSLSLPSADLRPAIDALLKAKSELEAEIHVINEETKDEVASWVANAKRLQEDILHSKTLANEIVRQSEAPDVSGRAIQAAEEKVEFLQRELRYSEQLHGVLRGVDYVNQLLGEVDAARSERRILDSLRLLEKSWTALDDIPVAKSCRVMKLLNLRTFELKSDVHEVFDRVWNSLVQVDLEGGKISIFSEREDEQMSLADAVIGLKAYKEVEERMIQLWHNVDVAIVSPRMSIDSASLPLVNVNGPMLELRGEADRSVSTLLTDLEKVLSFLSNQLPAELLDTLCPVMMDDIIPKLQHVWLDSAVPASLKDIEQFQGVIASTRKFCSVLEGLGLSGFETLKQWVGDAPSIWLSKCRETALDSVRTKLANGIGESRQVEKVERQMVTRSEGNELAASGPAVAADNDDWGAAWADDEDQPNNESEPQADSANAPAPSAAPDDGGDDGADAWGWGDDDDAAESQETAVETKAKGVENRTGGATQPPQEEDDEEDPAAAWGWGDEDATEDAAPDATALPTGKAAPVPVEEQTRELVLKETYNISSMPEPVLDLIFSILEDGASLTQGGGETSPVAAAAAGLFSLPTFALAMFRAISPYYYSQDIGGSMYLYNDASYLAEKLAGFSVAWKKRDDLSIRARNMLRLDNDVKSLRSFANRAYGSELTLQKTIIRDLIGGAQSLMQQDDIEGCINLAVARVRTMAVAWEPILSRSVWYQAVGSLADSVSQKIIADVTDMASIGQDEAYNIAQVIAKVTELDDLFLPSRLSGQKASVGQFATTPQYASSWLRLKFLSEVLQSNLNEVRYLWFDSELSLYFSAEEVVDLIRLSFEDNARSREVIREISHKPHPAQA